MARKRKFGPRGKSGRLLNRPAPERAVLDATIIQRSAMVGPLNAQRVEAESPVGRLLLSGRIERAHYDAAERLVRAWRVWIAMAHIPSRHGKVASYGELVTHGPRPDVAPEVWAAAKNKYLGAIDAVGLGLRWASVECLVIDCIAPPRIFEPGVVGQRVYEAMTDGLDALVDYFGVEREKAA